MPQGALGRAASATNRASGIGSGLQFSDQFTEPDLQRARDSHQSVHGNGFCAPLDCADINRMELSFFSQLLLAETGFLAFGSDGIAEFSAILRHALHRA